jgi:malate dehydrogenase (oxaloacetate-decarboxylating)(NADP+)
LAGLVTEADLAEGSLYPSLTRIREVSAAIGTHVAKIAYARALAPAPAPDDAFAHVRSYMYEPRYTDYVVREKAASREALMGH